ncbi:copper resistance protein CopC [Actinoplanes sp. NPDC023714]|uniref:copper resistance CopC/CopD family protein n=1 Tax=Actinoplanes sp. NPDC023714 TaxID=3154322 RepID=UPI0033D35D62
MTDDLPPAMNDRGSESVSRGVKHLVAARRGVHLLLAVVAGVLITLLPAAPASAHAVLSQASPQQGAVLREAPATITLVFSERVQVIPGRTKVFGPDGKRINDGDAVQGERGLSIAIRTPDRPLGTYLVSYRIISADSHPVSGAYTFSVGAPSNGPPPDLNDGVDPVVTAAVPAAKYVGYLGLVLAAGPVLMLALWYPGRLGRSGLLTMAWTGFGLIGASTLAALWLQAPQSSGAGVLEVSGGELADVLTSGFGLALIARLAIVAVLAALVSGVRRRAGRTTKRRAGRVRSWTLGLLALAGMLTWPLTGHPAASPQSAILVTADLVHIAAMAFWLGGLTVLAVFLLRRAEARELRVILPSWSRWAAISVYWLVAAGLLQAVVQTGTVDALFTTDYGRLLLIKTGLVIAVLAVAAVSRLLVRRATTTRLRTAVVAEVVIAVVVLAVSAVLVQTNPARTVDVEAAAAAKAKGFVTTLNSPIYAVQFEIFPAEVGEYNTLHAFAYTPEGKPLNVVEWRVTAALPERGIEPIENEVGSLLGNQGLGNVVFPYPGTWHLNLTLRISDIDQATVTTTVEVK